VQRRERAFHRSAKCAENRRTVVCRSPRRHILRRARAVPVETYHCMKSFCRCDSRFPSRPMKIARDSRIYFFILPSFFHSHARPLLFAFFLSRGLRVDDIRIVRFTCKSNDISDVGGGYFFLDVLSERDLSAYFKKRLKVRLYVSPSFDMYIYGKFISQRSNIRSNIKIKWRRRQTRLVLLMSSQRARLVIWILH